MCIEQLCHRTNSACPKVLWFLLGGLEMGGPIQLKLARWRWGVCFFLLGHSF